MSTTKKVVIIFTCIFAASVICIGIVLGIFFGRGNDLTNFNNIFGTGNFNVDESAALDLGGITGVRVECASADIHVVQSDEPKVTLKGVVISPAQPKQRLNVSEQDGILYINVQQDFFFFSLYCDIDLTVYLPEDSGLDASIICSSGNIDMSGMKFGDLAVSRSSGSLKIENCTASSLDDDASSGDTYIASSAFGSIDTLCFSGATTIIDTAGSMKVNATSGSVDIKGASGALDIGCTSGDVSIDIAPGAVPPVTATMTSGDLKFIVQKDAAFDLAANVTSGDITSDIDITISGTLPDTFVGDSVSGSCNGGGEKVSLSSTSGDISIIGK